jgi:hypothetical protein
MSLSRSKRDHRLRATKRVRRGMSLTTSRMEVRLPGASEASEIRLFELDTLGPIAERSFFS